MQLQAQPGHALLLDFKADMEVMQEHIAKLQARPAADPKSSSLAVIMPDRKVVMFHRSLWAKENSPVVREQCAARGAFCLIFLAWWNAKGSDEPQDEPKLPIGDAGKADFFDDVASLFKAGRKAPHSASNEFAHLLKACADATLEAAVRGEDRANHVLCFESDHAVQILKRAYICKPGVPISLATFKNKCVCYCIISFNTLQLT